jgi:Na+/proline symporter
MLILGGSATVTDLTGMNTVAACFLIPIGVSIYVMTGGMRATLVADYTHTLVLYCILIAFALTNNVQHAKDQTALGTHGEVRSLSVPADRVGLTRLVQQLPHLPRRSNDRGDGIVMTGGMRATLVADYTHTLVLYCILIAFALTTYADP